MGVNLRAILAEGSRIENLRVGDSRKRMKNRNEKTEIEKPGVFPLVRL